eukprot:6491654-Pyramimonas_sp.AAC.2
MQNSAAKLGASTWVLLASLVGCYFRPIDARDHDYLTGVEQNTYHKPEPVRIACIGDSITYGDGTQPLKGPYGENTVLVEKHEDRGSYPQFLQEFLDKEMPDVFKVCAKLC